MTFSLGEKKNINLSYCQEKMACALMLHHQQTASGQSTLLPGLCSSLLQEVPQKILTDCKDEVLLFF